ncbi:MAG: hypothetical protein ACMUHY_07745 [Thermoplasmatota archaeon]
MKNKDPIEPIDHLIGDPGFPSRDSLSSFCIAVGLFHDAKGGSDVRAPRKWDPSRYDIWPMLELVVYNTYTDLGGRQEMRDLLYRYLKGGAEMIAGKVGGRKGTSALREIARFIPP